MEKANFEAISKSKFIDTFKKYARTFRKELEGKSYELPEFYSTSSGLEWTINFFSCKASLTVGSPFGDFFIKKIKGLRYRTEDGLVDMGMSIQDNFKGLETFDKNGESIPLKTWNFFPSNYDVLVEHENDIWSCWQEIAKLAYSKAKLKVLITYNWNTNNPNEWSREISLVESYFSNILGQTNSVFPENPDTEYLLIVGFLERDELKWRFIEFNYMGEK